MGGATIGHPPQWMEAPQRRTMSGGLAPAPKAAGAGNPLKPNEVMAVGEAGAGGAFGGAG